MKIIIIFLVILSTTKNLLAQYIGINTPTPNAVLDVNGDIALRIANISLVAGVNNKLNVLKVLGIFKFFIK